MHLNWATYSFASLQSVKIYTVGSQVEVSKSVPNQDALWGVCNRMMQLYTDIMVNILPCKKKKEMKHTARKQKPQNSTPTKHTQQTQTWLLAIYYSTEQMFQKFIILFSTLYKHWYSYH